MTSGTITPGGPVRGRFGTDVDRHRSRGDEHVDQLLGECNVDLCDRARRTLAAVEAWVVDVDVEPVLVRCVADAAADFPAEVAALGKAEIAHTDAGRVRVGPPELAHDGQRRSHQVVRAPAAPVAVGRAPKDRVPGEERTPFGGKTNAIFEAPGLRRADRRRVAPFDSRAGDGLLGARLRLSSVSEGGWTPAESRPEGEERE